MWMSELAGKFIVLDGGDGSGKTTVVDRLEGDLTRAFVPVIRVREPGGTAYGEEIRRVLLRFKPESDEKVDPLTEVLLFSAARAQLLNVRILPALSGGYCVIADRFVTSTFAYQGCGGGVDSKLIMDIAKATIPAGHWPWATIVLDTPHEVAVDRMTRDGVDLDRIESMGDEYHQRVRRGFSQIKDVLDDVKVIDGSGNEDEVYQIVLQYLRSQLL